MEDIVSDRVWITRESKVIPFSEMSDGHLENAVAWCDIRIRNLAKAPKDARTNGTINREWARVADLRRDLEAELKDRCAKSAAPKPLVMEAIREGGRYEMLFEVPIEIGGWHFAAGDKIVFNLPKGKHISLLRTGPLPASHEF